MLSGELGSPPTLPALLDGVREKPFRALTEISLSRAMRMTLYSVISVHCLITKEAGGQPVAFLLVITQESEIHQKAQASRISKTMPHKRWRISR